MFHLFLFVADQFFGIFGRVENCVSFFSSFYRLPVQTCGRVESSGFTFVDSFNERSLTFLLFSFVSLFFLKCFFFFWSLLIKKFLSPFPILFHPFPFTSFPFVPFLIFYFIFLFFISPLFLLLFSVYFFFFVHFYFFFVFYFPFFIFRFFLFFFTFLLFSFYSFFFNFFLSFFHFFVFLSYFPLTFLTFLTRLTYSPLSLPLFPSLSFSLSFHFPSLSHLLSSFLFQVSFENLEAYFYFYFLNYSISCKYPVSLAWTLDIVSGAYWTFWRWTALGFLL